MPDDRALVPVFAAANRRMYREGTPNLIAAATRAGAQRLVAQSVAWRLPGETGDALEEHERLVLGEGGVVIRYGRFYGPGTYFEAEPPSPPRVHIDDAARETFFALETTGGVVIIADGAGRPDPLRNRRSPVRTLSGASEPTQAVDERTSINQTLRPSGGA
jgi:hypothetical protein